MYEYCCCHSKLMRDHAHKWINQSQWKWVKCCGNGYANETKLIQSNVWLGRTAPVISKLSLFAFKLIKLIILHCLPFAYHVNGDFSNFGWSMALTESFHILLFDGNFFGKHLFQRFVSRNVTHERWKCRQSFLKKEKKQIFQLLYAIECIT